MRLLQLALILPLLLWSHAADASCDQIPGTANTFRGARGSVNRPFAGPGDFVELRLSRVCDDPSAEFPADAADSVVTIAFTPPAGPTSLVVVAADCAALEADRQRCAAQAGIGRVVCRPAVDAVELFVRGDQHGLRFAFPDTDDLVGDARDDRTLTGPATIVVSRAGDRLRCDLSARPCAEQTGLIACVDALFAIDGTCDPNAHPQFSHFTALPPPNDAQALCIDPAPALCTARATEMRMTVDGAGNVLLPVDWQGVILSRALGISRSLNANAAVPAFPNTTEPLRIPGQAFLRSFALHGGTLAPVFEPRVDPTSVASLRLFGTTDAPRSVLWIARRSPTFQQCDGGPDDGRPCAAPRDCAGGTCTAARCANGSAAGELCSSDAHCPAGECGPSLFDFRSRLLAGVGPIVLPRFGAGLCQDAETRCGSDEDCGEGRCVTFRIAATEPVPLEGVIESSTLLSLVVPEAIDDRDLNGDGDARDDVLLVSDRQTGARLAIGEAAAAPYRREDVRAPGRAATRIHDAPFDYPAVASEGDLIAFLEAEPLQGRGDRNRDGDEFDTFLRVFRAGGASIAELTDGAHRAIDAAPAINGRSVVVEDGLVWFRTREASSAAQRISRVSVTSSGAETDGRSQHPAISADGTQVGFESATTNPAIPPGDLTSYVHDRRSGTTAPLFVEAPNVSTDSATLSPSLSSDARYAAVSTRDRDGYSQVFVVDRDADDDGMFDEPEAMGWLQASTDPEQSGLASDGNSVLPRVTPNGRFVAFLSDDTASVELLDPPLHVVVRDRDPDEDGVFEVDITNPSDMGNNDVADRKGYDLPTYGPPASPQAPAISADGRFVAFGHFDQNIPIADVNNYCFNPGQSRTTCVDILLKDRSSRALDLISVSSLGMQGNNHSLSPAMSADGRFAAFFSGADTLVPGDTNDSSDVFVFDRLTQTTVRLSVAPDGTQGDASTYDQALALSADGRFVAFASTASNLVAQDANFVCDNNLDRSAQENCRDVFVQDRLTRFTRRVSVAPDGTEANGQSGYPVLSADGTIVAFESQAANLVAGDGNVFCDHDFDPEADENCQDVFVAEPDPNDVAADLNGDGDLNDTVLQLLDSAAGGPVVTLAAASAVAVAGDCAAFLLPETAQAPGVDLNGDGDHGDEVAHLYCRADGMGIRNLGRAATAVALSRERIAILVSEMAQGGIDLNGDGDARDDVVAVASVSAPAEWINSAVAADRLAVSGARVAFASPESNQNQSLNGDDDTDDRVLYVLDGTAELLSTGQAVEDFVLQGSLLAFRTGEAAQGNHDLSGDGRVGHAVMQVYDIATRRLLNTQQTAVLCLFSSCDPRLPYRVGADTIKFLTLEGQQGVDLTGNGDTQELVLQVLNVRVAGGDGGAAGAADAPAGALRAIGSIRAGICADSGAACVSAEQCGNARACLVPPGRCVVNLGTPCILSDAFNAFQRCRDGEFCVASGAPGNGRCHAVRGLCDSDAQCEAPAYCQAGDRPQRLAAPLQSGAAGAEVFVDAGRCIASSDRRCDPDAEPADCAGGERCTAGNGGYTCQREHGSCRTDGDCPSDSRCVPELVVATAADSDADGLPDPFDNCPAVANIDQADGDANGVGDACQVAAATPTPTPSPEATATSTSAATATVRQSRDDDDGCAIGRRSRADWEGALMLGVVAMLLSIVRRGGYFGGALIIIVVLAAANRAFALCAGDCDGSGEVRVDEIVTLVAVAVTDMEPVDCRAGDRDANGRITVDELVGAVGGALRGCPTVGMNDTAAAALALVRGLSRVHGLAGAVSAAFAGAGGELECELGGTRAGICQDFGPGAVRSTLDVSACRKPTREGAVVLDGGVIMHGVGQCPQIVMLNGLRLDFDLDMTIEDETAVPVLTSRLDLEVVMQSIVSGIEPCRVKGADVRVTGDLSYLHAETADITLHFEDARAQTRFDQFFEGCDPLRVRNLLRGRLALIAPPNPMRIDALSEDLLVVVDREMGTVEVAGTVRGDYFNGVATVETIEPFDTQLGQCFTRGALRIDNRVGSLALRSNADGTVDVDVAADGSVETTWKSCRMLPSFMAR